MPCRTLSLPGWRIGRSRACPSNPEAWLLTVARRMVIDAARRRRAIEAATGHLQLLAEGLDAATAGSGIPDRRLALMFACAHPAIEAGIRAPLMLQAVLGLDAKTIASAAIGLAGVSAFNTRAYFSFIPVSVAAPTLMIATPPAPAQDPQGPPSVPLPDLGGPLRAWIISTSRPCRRRARPERVSLPSFPPPHTRW